MISLHVRDEALRRIGQVDDFTSLELNLKFNDVSSWQLVVDGASPAVGMLTDARGVIVVRDGVTLLSGPVLGKQQTLAGGRETVTFNGADDTVWLARRLALPSAAPYTAAAYDTATGPAETVLRGYVDRNLGASAVAARQLTYFTQPASAGIGSTVTGNARFDNLLALLQSLALAGGDLGFRIVQSGTGLTFDVYQPVDRSSTAVFSIPLGNLAAYDLKTSAPALDYVVVAGQGTGTGRVFVEGGDSASLTTYGRIEFFQDRRDTPDTTVLTQARDETLAANKPVTSLSLTPVDTASVTFGRDYNLGDKVTVAVAGQTVRDVVRQVNLKLSASTSELLTPTVGTPGATNPAVPALFAALRQQSRRITNLERQ